MKVVTCVPDPGLDSCGDNSKKKCVLKNKRGAKWGQIEWNVPGVGGFPTENEFGNIVVLW